jgi:hypothetical protein
MVGAILVLGILGCAAPKPAPAPAHPDLSPLQAEVEALRQQVARLQSEISHLRGEVRAASAEDGLTEMTIDAVGWEDELLGSIREGATARLLCHVKEWRGFGRMLRFTQKADQTFFLEADGLPPISGDTGEGGMCNDDGSIRYVMLTLTDKPAPGVAYRLRPQNTSEGYRWKVTDDVVVTGR